MVPYKQSTFGSILRRFRLAAGLSQEELAERSGLSIGSISSLERGIRRAPYRHTVAQLVAALGLPPLERALFEKTASKQPSRKRSIVASPDVSDPSGASDARAVRHAHTRVDAVPVLVARARERAWLQHELTAGSPLVAADSSGGRRS